jgi:hypothetical protein
MNLRDAFCDVLLGDENSIAVRLPDSQRTAHVAILGKSRFGKTTLLEHLVLNDMRSGTAAIVIDAHGDLSKRLIALAPFANRDKPDDPRARVVLVEPNTERPFGLNLYECQDQTDGRQVTATIGRIVEIFRKLMGAEGTGYLPLIESGLRNTARVLIANRLTMAELPLLYYDAAFRHRALAALPAPTGYWREYEASTTQKQQEKREPVLNKVARFLEDDLVASMVSQTHTTIPFQSIMDNGGTLLLNLAGLDRETVSFLGMVFLSVFSNLIHQREKIPPPQRKRVHLYLDEYGRFATPTTKRLLEEGGKYGLGVTIAHQNLAQTPEHEALDVQTLISFQLGAEDAYEVAGSFDCTPVRTKRVARQRTEAQYREWEERVWDSDRSRIQHEKLWQQVEEAKAAYDSANRQESVALRLLEALYGEETEGRTALQSSDGTVDTVLLVRRLEADREIPRAYVNQLRAILDRLYSRYGRVPRWEEALEVHEWRHHVATIHEQLYEESRDARPKKYEHYEKLKKAADGFYNEHTSLQRRTEYIGETPVKDDRGRVIYDNIDEIDQTHSDRQAEIANMLTQLPRYVAYCKIIGSGGKPRDHRVRTRSPAPLPTHADYRAQTETAEDKRGRQEHKHRFRDKGLAGVDLDVVLEWIPSVFSSEFQAEAKELERAVVKMVEDFITPESRYKRTRSASRERYGVSLAEVYEQVRNRQTRPPPEDGQAAPSPSKPTGPPPPMQSPPQAISRRSPKKRG